jgi:uncharacterized sporulation protein YeaH/YhbH (DUF444 family)
MPSDSDNRSAIVQSTRWYDLFSRGARDWLRHNEKVRESVKESLPELVAGPDVLTQPENRTVKVPIKFLEHYRFRISASDTQTGVGQGKGAQPGDVLRPAAPGGRGDGGAGTGEGGVEFVLEFKVDDILDWLWEELELPNLEPKTADSVEQSEYVREGIDRRGPRARLDRRRTVKEAVKRRAIQTNPIPFTNDDLRFRQLRRRPQPLTQAAIRLLQHGRRLASARQVVLLLGTAGNSPPTYADRNRLHRPYRERVGILRRGIFRGSRHRWHRGVPGVRPFSESH